MANSYVFDSIADLVGTLALCWTSDLFPEHVMVLGSGRFSLPPFGLRHVDLMAKQHGLKVRQPKSEPTGRRELLADHVVTHEWSFRDPLYFNADGTRRGSRTRRRREAGIEYLVAAQNTREAGRLLDRMLTRLTDGIEITPIVMNGAAPFAYFWLISSERPPLDVLDEAPRAWWGPADNPSRAFVFSQWPLALNVHGDFLQRVQWNAGKGFVLLSQDDPRRLVVTVPPDRVRSLTLDAFADFQPVATAHLNVDTASARTRFPVQLRLRPRTHPEAIETRMKRLQAEITTRQIALETLIEERDRLHEMDRVALTFPQPLLLYYTGDATEVPEDLRRLLIESSNQPGDLDALRCARFSAIDLPLGLDQPYEAVHVVTTARVTDGERGASDLTLPIRLQHHIPHEGAEPYFEQLDEWEPFDLHLFASRGTALRLHPRLQPGPVAAEKLASALFGRTVTVDERRQSLILLLPGERDRLVACHLPVAAFRPLARVFDWECGVNVDIGRTVTWSVPGEARAAVTKGLASSLEVAIEQERDRALEACKATIGQRMKQEAVLIAGYQTRLAETASSLSQVGLRWEQVRTHLRQLSLHIQRLNQYLTTLKNGLPDAMESIAATRKTANDLETERAALAKVQRDVDKLNGSASPGAGV